MHNTVQAHRDQEQAATWISAHLFHRGNLDQLITTAVAPLIQELTGRGGLVKWFFLRYWEGGPHLRLRLLPTRAADAEQLRNMLRTRVKDYLTEHPSPPAPAAHTTAAYQAIAEQIAQAERLAKHDTRLHPDDSVEFIPYQPEYTAYGPRPALSAVETHFTQSSTIALALLSTATPMRQRHAAALGMLMLTLAVCEPDLDRLTTRLRTLPTHKLPATDPTARTLQDSYRHLRPALQQQARHLWAQAADPHCPTSVADPLGAWLCSIRALHHALTAAQAQGQFAPSDSLSPLTRLSSAISSPHCAVTEVLLRCTHLLCNRLGIHTTAETHISSLLALTLTDLA